MFMSDPANDNYKKVCNYFPNLPILTKSDTPGQVQLAFTHASIGNKSLGESVTVFALTVSLDSPSIVLIDVNIEFSMDGDKIRLPIAEVFLRDGAGNFARSKKRRDWTPQNSVLLLPLLTEAEILDGQTSVEYLLKIFMRSITQRGEEEIEYGGDEGDEEIEEEEVQEDTNKKSEKKKKENAETLATTTYN